MQLPEENVGSGYDESRLLSAQSKTWQAVHAVARKIRPGHTEKDAQGFLKEVMKELGAEKIWHPPQIRFGANTLKPFGKPGEKDVPLSENDIFFLDIGPVFDGYEGDAGTTFIVGDDREMKQLAADAEAVFNEVREEWKKTGVPGRALYEFADGTREHRG